MTVELNRNEMLLVAGPFGVATFEVCDLLNGTDTRAVVGLDIPVNTMLVKTSEEKETIMAIYQEGQELEWGIGPVFVPDDELGIG